MLRFIAFIAVFTITTGAVAEPPYTPGKNPPGATLGVEDPAEYRGRKTEGLTPDLMKRILERKRAAGAPNRPDLDVLYIERTPRFPRYNVTYDHGTNPHLEGDQQRMMRWPDVGETVTFWGHVANKGLARSAPSSYRFLLDGKIIGEGKLPRIEPCDQVVVTAKWPWQTGRHTVTLQVDLDSENHEITELNNTLCDYTDAYTLFWTVRDHVYVEEESLPNNYGSYSCEDWHRSVMDWMNQKFAQCIWPLTPDGVPARVRIEYLWISPQPWVDHDKHPVNRFCDGSWPHYPGGRFVVEGAAPEQRENFFAEIRRTFETNHRYNPDVPGHDRALVHELSHQLGLIDVYHMNVPKTLCQVELPDGRLLRDVHPEEATKHSWVKGVMIGGEIPQCWSEHSAYALVRDYGKRRGYYGEYLLDLPSRNYIRVLNKSGQPLAQAKLTIYQRQGEAVPNTPVHEGTTERDGRFDLGAAPFGAVNVVGVNGSLLVHVQPQDGDVDDWVWTDVVSFNLAKWRGEDPAVVDVQTVLE